MQMKHDTQNKILFWYKRSKWFYIQFCSLKCIRICVFVVCVLSCAVGANLRDGPGQLRTSSCLSG